MPPDPMQQMQTPERGTSDAAAPGEAARPAARRWQLCRAGIINVYQYGDETLEFAGGRLLLRGVNGSGKSTAMNMLLPFLLEGETRRIDAAGEQSGVLRAWMLSGRDEPQPQGYLWLELARGEAYTSFGCGIRANRSTERVSTWWFITSRRPGIDLQLVEGRVPIGAEQLRARLEPGAVFGHEQRAAYREALRARLFGGSDLDTHLRLLHTVRSPRVGDRLDAELPSYLLDALPQLSEAALEDAAQPLEDLEEHRRNVAELSRTAQALAAIQEVYGSYARAELHALAQGVLGAVALCDERRREQGRAQAEQRAAAGRLEGAAQAKQECERERARLHEQIRAFEASEAYQSGAQLGDLRRHVESLARSAHAAQDAVARRRDATAHAASETLRAARESCAEQEELRARLVRLAELAAACGLAARPPGAPVLSARVGHGEAPELPDAALATAAADRELGALRAAARQRRADVQEVEDALRTVQAAEQTLGAAEQLAEQTERAHGEARVELEQTRSAFQAQIEHWSAASRAWLEELARHCAEHGLGAPAPPAALEDPAGRAERGEPLGAPLLELVDGPLEHHRERRAALGAELAQRDEALAELRARQQELAAKRLPDPPAQPWQHRGARPCLAELVEFTDELDEAGRAGLEAALQAAGLLGAEVWEDGTLRLAQGQLAVRANEPDAPAPLSRLLRVSLPEDGDAAVPSAAAVERVLRAISSEPEAPDARSAVSTAGEFRLGALRGRHTKPCAEHIGLGARRAALERQRAAAAAALARAQGERDALALRAKSAQGALAQALALRRSIPDERGALGALARRGAAERQLEHAAAALGRRRAQVQEGERELGCAAERLQQSAARLALPRTREALRAIREDLETLARSAPEAQAALARLGNAVERWRGRGAEWERACADQRASEEQRERAGAELAQAQARLHALEASIGVAYAQVVAAIESSQKELALLQQRLSRAEAAQLEAQGALAAAHERERGAAHELERAFAECLRVLPLLRRALEVPGLVEAALGTTPARALPDEAAGRPAPDGTAWTRATAPGAGPAAPAADTDSAPSATGSAPAAPASAADSTAPAAGAFPIVDDHPEGARRLAQAVRAQIPAPDEAPTRAEGVRQSLRRRREGLGAGWDAEDHQPDPQLPLRIDVTGPLAPQLPLARAASAVDAQLHSLTQLLSAKQDQALRNLLQGLVAREVAEKLHAAGELIAAMNRRLGAITTAHGIGVKLRWRRRADLDEALGPLVALLAKPPDLRTAEEDSALRSALGERIDDARRSDPDLPYRELIGRVLDYRGWHELHVLLRRPGQRDERLERRSALSEGEKKIVSYLPLFAAVAASCDALAERAPDTPRFVLLDDAFAKVSEDNHAKLFGLLVELDLDFIATSERLWGTHETVPELAITEVIRDAELGAIALEHSRWDGRRQVLQ